LLVERCEVHTILLAIELVHVHGLAVFVYLMFHELREWYAIGSFACEYKAVGIHTEANTKLCHESIGQRDLYTCGVERLLDADCEYTTIGMERHATR
jgi:hypothetical protein